MTRFGARIDGDAALVGITAAMLLSRLWFVFNRVYDLDELSTMHAAWNISRGLVIYRDFFEHHTPAVYFLLAPVVGVFHTDADPAAAAHALAAGRLVMGVFAAATVALIGAVGALWRGRRTGLLAAAFAATSALFLDLTLEIRQDVPALFCFVASIAALLAADRSTRARAAWIAAAGAALGAATMFAQKYAVVVPAMALAAAIVGDTPPAATARRRLTQAAVWLAAAALPVAATLAWFAAHDALGSFLWFNVAFNASLHPAPFGVLGRLPGITLRNPWLVVGGAAGALTVWKARPRAASDRALLVIAAGAAALVAAVPLPYSQHYLPLVPPLALFGARLWPRAGVAMAAACAVYATVVLAVTFERAAPQVAEIEYLMSRTGSADPVLDGFTGYGVFRPSAWFYGYVNHVTINPEIEAALAAGLESERIRPKVVLFDETLSAFPTAVTGYVREHYRPLHGIMWERRP